MDNENALVLVQANKEAIGQGVSRSLLRRLDEKIPRYIRDDLYRGNLIYTGISGAFWLKNYFAKRDELQPVAGAWRTTERPVW